MLDDERMTAVAEKNFQDRLATAEDRIKKMEMLKVSFVKY